MLYHISGVGLMAAATAAFVVVVVATTATATIAAATAATTVVLWQVIGSGFTHQHHYTLVCYTFAGKTVVEIHCHFFVTYVDYYPLHDLPAVIVLHGESIAFFHNVRHEVPFFVVERAAVNLNYHFFVARAKCLFGREHESEIVALGKSLQLARETFEYARFGTIHEVVGCLRGKFIFEFLMF